MSEVHPETDIDNVCESVCVRESMAHQRGTKQRKYNNGLIIIGNNGLIITNNNDAPARDETAEMSQVKLV
jgi:hypothetical protein